jgi:hypothetical protein
MNNMKIRTLFYPMLLLLLFTNCKKTNDSDAPVPDPEGTITGEISYEPSGGLAVKTFPITWKDNDLAPKTKGRYCAIVGASDKIEVSIDGYARYAWEDDFTCPKNRIYECEIGIIDIGVVSALGNIRKIPDADWTNETTALLGVAPLLTCTQGHGYIIKIKTNVTGVLLYTTEPGHSTHTKINPGDSDYWEEIQYVRLYVVEPVFNSTGERIGAIIKYQYPFIPE